MTTYTQHLNDKQTVRDRRAAMNKFHYKRPDAQGGLYDNEMENVSKITKGRTNRDFRLSGEGSKLIK